MWGIFHAVVQKCFEVSSLILFDISLMGSSETLDLYDETAFSDIIIQPGTEL